MQILRLLANAQVTQRFTDLSSPLRLSCPVIFGNEGPVPCQINELELLSRDASVTCRRGTVVINNSNYKKTPPMLHRHDSPENSPHPMLENFGRMMIQGMEAMPKNQQDMMQMILHPNQHTPSPQGQLDNIYIVEIHHLHMVLEVCLMGPSIRHLGGSQSI